MPRCDGLQIGKGAGIQGFIVKRRRSDTSLYIVDAKEKRSVWSRSHHYVNKYQARRKHSHIILLKIYSLSLNVRLEAVE